MADDRIFRRSVTVFREDIGHVVIDAGTKASDVDEDTLEHVTNPKAFVSRETMDEDFGLVPEGWTREDFVRAAAANSGDNSDTPEPSEDDDDDLADLTVQELHEVADAEGIDLGEATKKADIKQAIRDARVS